MELIKTEWKTTDKKEFLDYLLSFSKGERSSLFEQKILNTNYPCIAVPCRVVDKIVSEIYKGNYLSFIELWICDNHTALTITGKLIAKIKDFETFQKYLLKYLELVDGWAGCDSLKLKVKDSDKENYFNLSKSLVNHPNTFFRRFGFIILFKLINDEYIDRILSLIKLKKDEKEYYVNMAISWLIAECFVKFRDKTLNIIQERKLNSFVCNKAISKCRDSFRVSNEDKELLKKYRIK